MKPTNRLNQQLTKLSNHQPIKLMTDQKHLFGKDKNDKITKTENKWTMKTDNSMRPNAIRRLTKQLSLTTLAKAKTP